MKLSSTITCLALGCILAACHRGQTHSEKPPAAALPAISTGTVLQTEIDQFRSMNGLPAIAIALVDQDKVVSAVSGERRFGSGDPVQLADIFQLGSNTKAMTATLIARLVEQHKLRWDSTLAEIFPTWRDQMNPAFLRVTVAQLLQHRAGLIRDFGDLADADLQEVSALQSGNISADRTSATLWFLKRPPQITPNTSFQYSNIGYLIVGVIAEAVGGESYENLMASEVFSPLQMQGYFGMPESADLNNVAGHIMGVSGWEMGIAPPFSSDPENGVAQFHQWLSMVSAAGGVSLPLSDYGLFLREQLRGLEGSSHYLTQTSAQQMHTPADSQDNYGLGWLIIKDIGTQNLGPISLHDGSVGTYYSIAILIPKYNRAVAVVCNCYAPGIETKLSNFAKTLARIQQLKFANPA